MAVLGGRVPLVEDGRPQGGVPGVGEAAGREGGREAGGADGLRGGMRPPLREGEVRVTVLVTRRLAGWWVVADTPGEADLAMAVRTGARLNGVTLPAYGFSLVRCAGARWGGEVSWRELAVCAEGGVVEEGRRSGGRRPREERRGERLRRLRRWGSRR